MPEPLRAPPVIAVMECGDGLYSGGQSFQRQPGRSTWRMPPMTRRSSTRCVPPEPRRSTSPGRSCRPGRSTPSVLRRAGVDPGAVDRDRAHTQQPDLVRQQQHLQEACLERRPVDAAEGRDRVVIGMQGGCEETHGDAGIGCPLDPPRREMQLSYPWIGSASINRGGCQGLPSDRFATLNAQAARARQQPPRRAPDHPPAATSSDQG